MKNRNAMWAIAASLSIAGPVAAQEPRPPAAAVEGIKGVKEDAVAKIKNVEPGVATGTKNAAQGVNKIDGIDTINGVKAAGRTAVQPPPPPPIVPAGGTAIPAGGGSVGSAANIRAVKGVGGIDAAKLRNLEAALTLKNDAGGTPTGKGQAAAAALGGPPGKPGPKTKEDGRAGFQEFEKLQNNGS